ncbi:hypothetical protein PVAP13_4KG350688 [Panicum virgatum]|uniref:Uncharacterized protein n=1 Tax=Panicum virgatum TaxID=38727 RepID=A0A8T0TWM8_PANVG|nr:hypothetical protein PVAP13_4KG350688 [Panicum virgatum]
MPREGLSFSLIDTCPGRRRPTRAVDSVLPAFARCSQCLASVWGCWAPMGKPPPPRGEDSRACAAGMIRGRKPAGRIRGRARRQAAWRSGQRGRAPVGGCPCAFRRPVRDPRAAGLRSAGWSAPPAKSGAPRWRGAPGSLLLLSGELQLGFFGGEAAMARRRTPACAPPLSGGEAAMVATEHAAAQRTAASTAAAARPPSPFPRRSRRLALSCGGSGALAPRRLDSNAELPLPPSSLFRPPRGAWVPLRSPRPVSTSHHARPPAQEASTGVAAWPWRAGAVTTRAPLSSGAAPPRAPQTELGRGSRGRSSTAPSFAPARSPPCGSRRHPHGLGGRRPRRRPEAAAVPIRRRHLPPRPCGGAETDARSWPRRTLGGPAGWRRSVRGVKARRPRGRPAGRRRPCSPRPRGAELFVLNPGRRGVTRGPPSLL